MPPISHVQHPIQEILEISAPAAISHTLTLEIVVDPFRQDIELI
jgi:hypothetical protein